VAVEEPELSPKHAILTLDVDTESGAAGWEIVTGTSKVQLRFASLTVTK
jgi:hypothetical protein